MHPWYYFKYTIYCLPQKKEKKKAKEKLAKLYTKTLSHLRLHQLQIFVDSQERLSYVYQVLFIEFAKVLNSFPILDFWFVLSSLYSRKFSYKALLFRDQIEEFLYFFASVL